MFRENTPKNEQVEFFCLSSEEERSLDESWAGEFYREVFCKIDETDFEPLYSEKDSRPNIPVNVLFGALLLKELKNINDDELMFRLTWDLGFRWALDLKGRLGRAPFCQRTLTYFRTALCDHQKRTGTDLVHVAVSKLLKGLAKTMGVDGGRLRMDSFLVASNVKNLSRPQILYESSRACLKEIAGAGFEIPEGLSHYLEANDSNRIFYYGKSGGHGERTATIIKEAKETLALAGEKIPDSGATATLRRVVDEQLTKDGDEWRLRKDKSEGLNSRTVQTPKDPDCTFRIKYGNNIGYVANVVEAGCGDGSMILDYEYGQNVLSDSAMLKNFLSNHFVVPGGSETWVDFLSPAVDLSDSSGKGNQDPGAGDPADNDTNEATGTPMAETRPSENDQTAEEVITGSSEKGNQDPGTADPADNGTNEVAETPAEGTQPSGNDQTAEEGATDSSGKGNQDRGIADPADNDTSEVAETPAEGTQPSGNDQTAEEGATDSSGKGNQDRGTADLADNDTSEVAEAPAEETQPSGNDQTAEEGATDSFGKENQDRGTADPTDNDTNEAAEASAAETRPSENDHTAEEAATDSSDRESQNCGAKNPTDNAGDAANPSEKENGTARCVIVADGAYAGHANEALAGRKGVQIVPTQLTGKPTPDINADFVFDEKGETIVMCPNGKKPIDSAYKGEKSGCLAHFKKSDCDSCPLRGACKPKEQKKAYYKRFTYASHCRAKAVRARKGEDFGELAKFRNGVEAVPALMRNKHNVDRMPVRGLIRSGQFFGVKIGGAAFSKYLSYLNRKRKRESSQNNSMKFILEDSMGEVCPNYGSLPKTE